MVKKPNRNRTHQTAVQIRKTASENNVSFLFCVLFFPGTFLHVLCADWFLPSPNFPFFIKTDQRKGEDLALGAAVTRSRILDSCPNVEKKNLLGRADRPTDNSAHVVPFMMKPATIENPRNRAWLRTKT